MERGTNSLAVVSLASGLASWLVLPLVAAIAAVITGHMARRQIRRSGEGGAKMALAGLILGYVNLAAAVAGVVLGVLFWVTIAAYLTYGA